FTPGNLRFVRQFPAATVVVRREDLFALDQDSADPHRLCAALAERGRRVLYTPETVVVVAGPPLFRPHLRATAAAGAARGAAVRHHGLRGVTTASVFPVALLAFAVLGWLLLLGSGAERDLWVAIWALYGALLVAAGALAALRFRSVRV